MKNIYLFNGNSNTILSKKISKYLKVKLSKATVGRFSDGEISVKINENVRGGDIFVIQSICYPSNDNIMELLIMVDALRRASAGRITAVIPYFGYARQDKKTSSARVPITAKIIADFLSNVGVDRILTIDLHAEQIQGFFDIPVDNIFSGTILTKNMFETDLKNPIIISPDIGGVIRARTIAKSLNDLDMAIIHKRRPKNNKVKIMHIIGNVNNRDCIIVDDIIDTGNTICKVAKTLKKNNANNIFAYITHPILSGISIKNLKCSNINKIIVCDTIPLKKKINNIDKIKVITVSKILAKSIIKINSEKSISEMFKNII
ncbi:Ribose-phosphate pyrophosphokinase [Candidatus Annandia adelgestsuga]|uniref:Ribose-phosphate pyrophosphokinase n=1 Tax=Candidatus Annandia adelgestsuga TaxID=1302411 RepID=A0A3Q9CKX9_9ENTR|nr:ribose-phosphate pyrophosphokinase [Candidatus Annandia adelgestsuga]AZP36368.1 Ribose-phosphate pyrophosphokinase [Candidatus Annandia adelgestsuga]